MHSHELLLLATYSSITCQQQHYRTESEVRTKLIKNFCHINAFFLFEEKSHALKSFRRHQYFQLDHMLTLKLDIDTHRARPRTLRYKTAHSVFILNTEHFKKFNSEKTKIRDDKSILKHSDKEQNCCENVKHGDIYHKHFPKCLFKYNVEHTVYLIMP